MQEKAKAVENDTHGLLPNFGLKVGIVGRWKFEAHALELIAELPDLEEVICVLLAARRQLREGFAKLHREAVEIANGWAGFWADTGSKSVRRTSIMLATKALTTNRSMYPKDLSRRSRQKTDRTPTRLKKRFGGSAFLSKTTRLGNSRYRSHEPNGTVPIDAIELKLGKELLCVRENGNRVK